MVWECEPFFIPPGTSVSYFAVGEAKSALSGSAAGPGKDWQEEMQVGRVQTAPYHWGKEARARKSVFGDLHAGKGTWRAAAQGAGFVRDFVGLWVDQGFSGVQRNSSSMCTFQPPSSLAI